MARKKTAKIRHYLLPALASVLLSAGIGHTVMERFYPVPAVNGDAGEEIGAQSGTQPRPGENGPAGSPPDSKETAGLSRSMAKLHLFGEMPTQDAAPPPPTGEEAPETTLKLELRGVIAAVGNEGSFAIIADAKGQQEHYTTGDSLPAGAAILAIHDEYVVLRHHGRMETLRMPEGPSGGAGGLKAEDFLPRQVKKKPPSRRTRRKTRRPSRN